MARFNPWLGTQVGSVGDLVNYRRNGKQVQRVRVRNIANPRTEAQAKNRAVLATMGAAYSYMQGIVDHSFQNKNSKSENMQEFQKLNQGIARSLDNAPAFDAQQYNYNFKGESVLRPNPYAIARGTLPAVQIVAPAEGSFSDGFTFGGGLEALFGDDAANLTYNDVAALFGVELGSQLTICIISDDTFTGTPSSENMPKSYGNFHFCRIILTPDDGDGTKKFWTITASKFTVTNANRKNQGSFYIDVSDGAHAIVVAGQRYPLAVGAILSNYNGRWLRSNTDMVVAEDYVYSNGMAEVFNSYMDATGEQPASPLYLNQSIPESVASEVPVVGVLRVASGGLDVTPVNGVYQISGENFSVYTDSDLFVQPVMAEGVSMSAAYHTPGGLVYTFVPGEVSEGEVQIGTAIIKFTKI